MHNHEILEFRVLAGQIVGKRDDAAGRARTPFQRHALHHRVARAQGPERIAPEWWRDEGARARVRDYYRVEDEAGRRFWLFRAGLYGEAAERDHVRPEDVQFKAAQILVLTAMDIESRVIAHYGSEWSGSGFGSNDPGRERETTNKPEQGFDASFPIDIDSPLEVLEPGQMTAHDALVALKIALPYTLRFELEPGAKGSHAFRTRPHPDLPAALITVPAGALSVRDAMRLIMASLPAGWQATYFVSHVILYKENRQYTHGVPI